jgi:hypothetical protein
MAAPGKANGEYLTCAKATFAMKDCIRQSAASVESMRTCGILFVGLLVWVFIEFTEFFIVGVIGFLLVFCFFLQISQVDVSEILTTSPKFVVTLA